MYLNKQLTSNTFTTDERLIELTFTESQLAINYTIIGQQSKCSHLYNFLHIVSLDFHSANKSIVNDIITIMNELNVSKK